MNTKTLDFIVIGAQKSGTTSLFRYLQGHPKLYLPPEKEAPFFDRTHEYSHGWSGFVKEYFGSAPADKIWGKVTPHYMASPNAAQGIYDQLPGVKLIALLRNPIDRAFSHYKMMVRRGVEGRTFALAVDSLRSPTSAEEARLLNVKREAEIRCYLVWGEYGRILSSFMKLFDRKQLLVIFTDDFAVLPGYTLEEVLQFLGLETGYVPSNLGKRYHVGGTQQRLPELRKLVRVPPVSFLWRIVPLRKQRRITYWYTQWNTVPAREEPVLEFETRQTLVQYFNEDVSNLQNLLGLRVPWSEFL